MAMPPWLSPGYSQEQLTESGADCCPDPYVFRFVSPTNQVRTSPVTTEHANGSTGEPFADTQRIPNDEFEIAHH